jgi:hypothetical protein
MLCLLWAHSDSQGAVINVPTDLATIQAALNVAGANDIIVEAGYASTTEALSISDAGETITGGGKTVSSITVTVTGSATVGSLTLANANAAVGSHVIVNGGSLTLNNCPITATNAAGAATSCCVNVLGGGTLVMNGCTGTSTMVNGEFISLYTGNLMMTNSTVTATTGAGMFALGIALATGGAENVNIDGCTFTTTRNCMRTNATNIHNGTISITNSTFTALAPAGTALIVNAGTQNATLTVSHSTLRGGSNNAVQLNGVMTSTFNDVVLEVYASNVADIYVNAAYNGALNVTSSTLRSVGAVTATNGIFWAAIPGSTLALSNSVIDTAGNGILVGANWPWNSATSINNVKIYCQSGMPFDYDPVTGNGAISFTNCELRTLGTSIGLLHRGPQALNLIDTSLQSGAQAIWSNLADLTFLRTTIVAGTASATTDAIYTGTTGITTLTDSTVTNQASGFGIYKNLGGLSLNNTDITNSGNSGIYLPTSGPLTITGSSISTVNGSALSTDAPATLTGSDFVTSSTGTNFVNALVLNCGTGDATLTNCIVTQKGAGPDPSNSWVRPAINAPMTGKLTFSGCTINTDLAALASDGILNPTEKQPSRLIIDNSTINAKGIGVMMGRNSGTSWTMQNTLIHGATGQFNLALDSAVSAGKCQLYAKDCTLNGMLNAGIIEAGEATFDHCTLIGSTYGLVGSHDSAIALLNDTKLSTASQALYLGKGENASLTASNTTFDMGYSGQNLAWQSAVAKSVTTVTVELSDCVINGSGGTALALNIGNYPYVDAIGGAPWKLTGTTIGNVASVFRTVDDNQIDFLDCHLTQSVLSGLRNGSTVNLSSSTLTVVGPGTGFLVEQPGRQDSFTNTIHITSSTLSNYPYNGSMIILYGTSTTLNQLTLVASDFRTSNAAIIDQVQTALQLEANHCRFVGGSNTILLRGAVTLGHANQLLFDQCDFFNEQSGTVMWAQPGTTGDIRVRDSILYHGAIYNGVPGGAANTATLAVQNCLATDADPLQVGVTAIGTNKLGVDPHFVSTVWGDPKFLGLYSDSPALAFNSSIGGPETYVGAIGLMAKVPSAVSAWDLY